MHWNDFIHPWSINNFSDTYGNLQSIFGTFIIFEQICYYLKVDKQLIHKNITYHSLHQFALSFFLSLATHTMVIWFRKQIFLFTFEPKNERNCFLISALRIWNRSYQKIKVSTYNVKYPLINIIKCINFFWLDPF